MCFPIQKHFSESVYSLVDQMNAVRDPTFGFFWPSVSVGSSFAHQKMVGSLV